MHRAFRARLFHCVDDPGSEGNPAACEYFEDGLLVVRDGEIAAIGDAENLLRNLEPGVDIEDYSGKLILPGLIDSHVHFAQLDIIASYGAQLLDWLQQYAYVEEQRFASREYAATVANAFLDELLKNGTTSALVFATVFPQSADAFFEAAAARGMRLVAGKVLMDRNCPAELCDDAATAYAESEALIERWHGHGRLGYAITPRFALTSTAAQLQAAGKLAADYPDTWIHTHLAENTAEVEEIAELFPDRRSYLDVYDHFGLLRDRSVFAHCLHLDDADRKLLAARGGSVAFCPTSNLFLGSGLFDLQSMADAGIPVGLATDVGGGTSLSMLRTMGEAYKVLQLRQQSLPATRALYLGTLGAARALGLDEHIGNFAIGKEADFIVVDPTASSISARRAAAANSVDELLFSLLFLGDDRNIAATYLQGSVATGQESLS